jgi:hypothetical protein
VACPDWLFARVANALSLPLTSARKSLNDFSSRIINQQAPTLGVSQTISILAQTPTHDTHVKGRRLTQANVALRTNAILVTDKESDKTQKAGRDQQNRKHNPADL